MNATAVLDAIARKHSNCALVREITVTDRDALDPVRDAWSAWEPGDPMPEYDGTPVYRRIDGLMFDGGATRTAIEVKISRADFLRESEEKPTAVAEDHPPFRLCHPSRVVKAGGDPGRVRTLGNRRQCSADHQARPLESRTGAHSAPGPRRIRIPTEPQAF